MRKTYLRNTNSSQSQGGYAFVAVSILLSVALSGLGVAQYKLGQILDVEQLRITKLNSENNLLVGLSHTRKMLTCHETTEEDVSCYIETEGNKKESDYYIVLKKLVGNQWQVDVTDTGEGLGELEKCQSYF